MIATHSTYTRLILCLRLVGTMPRLTKKKLRIGDLVSVRLGTTIWRARLVEDRGHIGVKGRQLFRLQLLSDQDEVPMFVEVPEDRIEVPHD